jgi:hypothetical protein
MSQEKEATLETRRLHEADMEILGSAKTQDRVASPLGAPTEDHMAVSQRVETETAQDTRHGDEDVLDLRKYSHPGEILVGININLTTELTTTFTLRCRRR